jgi:hypothetical protein
MELAWLPTGIDRSERLLPPLLRSISEAAPLLLLDSPQYILHVSAHVSDKEQGIEIFNTICKHLCKTFINCACIA